MTNPTSRRACGITVGLLSSAALWHGGSVQAQPAGAAAAPPPAPPPKPRWEQSIAAGATLNRGNSDSFQGTLSYTAVKKMERDELLGYAGLAYGETKQNNGQYQKTDDYLKGGFQWNHLFTPRFYGGLKLDALHDDIADVDYRFTVSPLAGYYFIKNPNTRLSGEAGPSAVFERQGGEDKSYFALRFAEKFEQKLNDRAKIWQSLEYLPQVDDFNNYILLGEIGLETAITKTFALRLVAQDAYDNEPAPDREKNDFKLIASIAYKF